MLLRACLFHLLAALSFLFVFVSICGFFLSPKTLLIFCFFYKAQVPREIYPKYFWIPFSGVTRGLVGNSKMPVSWEILESSVNSIFSLWASLTSRAHCAYSSMFVECGNWSWKGIPRTVLLEMIFACVVTCVFLPACWQVTGLNVGRLASDAWLAAGAASPLLLPYSRVTQVRLGFFTSFLRWSVTN